MNSVLAFCNRIKEKDLLPPNVLLDKQQKELRLQGILQWPLPFDSVSKEVTGLNSLLIKTINDRSEDLNQLLHTSLSLPDQDKFIIVAAAPSGAGKTHLAHALGKNWSFVCVIRIASADGQSFALPWTEFINNINYTCARVSDDLFFRAKFVYTHLELLMATYFDVAIEVMNSGLEDDLHIDGIRELLLRFFRNGISDEIVLEKFKENIHKSDAMEINNYQQKKHDDIIHQSSCFVTNYIKDINARRNNIISKLKSKFSPEESCLHLTFCLDESQVLLDKFPQLFIQRSDYMDIKAGVGIDTITLRMRGLFYGLSCVCRDFLVKYNIGIYLTGTNFSIARLDSEGNFESTNRGKIRTIESNNYFTTNDMIELIRHYYHLSDGVFEDGEIKQLLRAFQGRPLFFVNFVFAGLPSIMSRLRNDIGSWKLYLKDCLSMLEQHLQTELVKFFTSYKLVPGADHLTVKSLLPSLVQSVLCGTGHLFLSDETIEEAITERVIPLTTSSLTHATQGEEGNDQRPTSQIIFLPEIEPTSFKCIKDFLLKELRKSNGFEYFLNLLLEFMRGEKGIVVEQFVAYYIALKSHLFVPESRPPDLYVLLAPLFPYHDSPQDLSYLNSLRSYTCKASQVIDIRLYRQIIPSLRTSCELEIFSAACLAPYNLVPTSVICYHFDPLMGLDLAMIVTDSNREERLVAMQSKNWAEGGLKEALLTLSPGLQYLKNQERLHVFRGEPLTTTTTTSATVPPVTVGGGRGGGGESVGYGSPSWERYRVWTQQHPQLAARWIRICLLAQVPTLADYVHIHSQLLLDFQQKIHKISWRFDRRYRNHCKALFEAMSTSPLFVLSYNSSHWLSEAMRRKVSPPALGTIGKPTKSKSDIRGTAYPNNDNNFYFPVTLSILQRLMSDP